jgi:hypothetical protein
MPVLPVAAGAGCWLLGLGAGCWLLGAGSGSGCWVLGAGCWLLVAGCWLLVAGCWLLVAGCWLLVLVLLSHGKPTPFFYALSCTLTGAVAKFLPVLVVLPVGAGAGAGLFW